MSGAETSLMILESVAFDPTTNQVGNTAANKTKIAELNQIFDDGVVFANQAQAEQAISLAAAIIVQEKDPGVREAAFMTLGRIMEEEREEGFGSSKSDWANARLDVRPYLKSLSAFEAAASEVDEATHESGASRKKFAAGTVPEFLSYARDDKRLMASDTARQEADDLDDMLRDFGPDRHDPVAPVPVKTDRL